MSRWDTRPQNYSDKTKDYLRETLLPISYCALYTRMALKWYSRLSDIVFPLDVSLLPFPTHKYNHVTTAVEDFVPLLVDLSIMKDTVS